MSKLIFRRKDITMFNVEDITGRLSKESNEAALDKIVFGEILKALNLIVDWARENDCEVGFHTFNFNNAIILQLSKERENVSYTLGVDWIKSCETGQLKSILEDMLYKLNKEVEKHENA